MLCCAAVPSVNAKRPRVPSTGLQKELKSSPSGFSDAMLGDCDLLGGDIAGEEAGRV